MYLNTSIIVYILLIRYIYYHIIYDFYISKNVYIKSYI